MPETIYCPNCGSAASKPGNAASPQVTSPAASGAVPPSTFVPQQFKSEFSPQAAITYTQQQPQANPASESFDHSQAPQPYAQPQQQAQNRYAPTQKDATYTTQVQYRDSVEPLSVKDYLIMFIVITIPIIGLIFLFKWAFGADVNENKKNYCKAALLLMVISIVIGIVFVVVLGGTLGSMMYQF